MDYIGYIKGIRKIFRLDELDTIEENRLILSLFCFLIFILLLYFWIISRVKIKENNKDGSGLVYISFAFLLYFVIGLSSVYLNTDTNNNTTIGNLILSGLISLCYLSALSFFSIGTHAVDTWVNLPSWKNGVKYFAFAWIVFVSLLNGQGSAWKVLAYLDIAITVIAFGALSFFVVRYFLRRGLRFIAVVSAFYFIASILLQFRWPDSAAGGKFIHISSVLIAPAFPLAVITLAYTFNWINELNFYELSNIWVSNDSNNNSQKAYSKLTTDANRETWTEKIANDELEKVIEEMIILKRHKNESLEAILNIASRNTRNNNNYMKDMIKYEDYQLNRNKVSAALLGMV
jgi:Effector-associated domain 11